ncbi:SDR family NAD(P)-dependent oxidoreductase [Vitiosangium sp. GDMCC 1.1324]|uniref:SDR family NAD(P)-dependent oxidoreductase n=1 Tax=Vitiosangium sp. (strain GDMCC 1.1324) TaxID=2138576 RepID=UPI0018EEA6FA|nr:SDR family NAD(P)-dependent oxidoreductase [Vitiosangium sp. GDMCC 1.1324]
MITPSPSLPAPTEASVAPSSSPRDAGAKRVYAAARRPEQVDTAGGAVVPLALDVTDPSSIARVAEEVQDVTLLVNNAGAKASLSALTSPLSRIQEDFATNVFGTLAFTRALLPVLESVGGGAIVNVLAVVSLASMPAVGGYSTSKAAAMSLTQALRGELASRGVRVHAVFPGPVDTEMAKDIQLPKTSPEAVARAILEGVARGDEDILPDLTSREVFAAWARDPESVERQLAAI